MRIILALFSVLFLMLVAAVAAPFFIDANQYKGRVFEEIKKATGYQLAIDGDIDLSFVSGPSLTLNKVSVTKQDAAQAFVTLDSLRVQLALLPLLSKQIVVKSVLIDQAKADLVQNAQGDNFMPVKKQAEPDAQGSDKSDAISAKKNTPDIRVDMVRITDSSLRYNGMDVTLTDVKARVESLQGPFSLSGDITYNAVSYGLDGRIGGIASAEMPVQMDVTVNDNAAQLRLSGTVKNLTQGADKAALNAQLEVKIPTINKVMQAFSASALPPHYGDQGMAAQLTVSGGPKAISITDGQITYKKQTIAAAGDITLGDAMAANITLSDLPGQGRAVLSHNATRSQITMDSVKLYPVLGDWLSALPKTLNPAQLPKQLDGTIAVMATEKGQPMRVALKGLQLDGQDVNGSLSYTKADKGRDQLAVAIKTGALNFNLAQGGASSNASTDSASGAGNASSKAAMQLPTLQPLPFDLDADISMAGLKFGTILLDDAAVKGRWIDKKLTLDRLNIKEFNGMRIAASGSVADVTRYDGVDMVVSVKTAKLGKVLSGFSLPAVQLAGQDVNVIAADVSYKGNKDAGDVVADIQAKGFTLAAKGRLNDPLSAQMPDAASISIRHADAAQAIKTFAPGVNSDLKGPLAIDSALQMKGKTYALTGLKITAGTAKLNGDATLSLEGARPSLKATIKADTLPVSTIIGAPSAGAGSSPGGASSAKSSGNTGNSPWSREAMKTDALRAMDADIDLSAKTLIYNQWILTNVTTQAVLKNGLFQVKDLKADLFEGQMAMTMKLDAPQPRKAVLFDQDITFTDVQMGPLVRAITNQRSEKITGVANLAIDLKGTGISTSALVYSLAGNGRLSITNPVAKGFDLDGLDNTLKNMNSSNLLGSLAGAAQKSLGGGETELADIDHNFAVQQGTTTLSDFTVQTKSGNGRVRVNGPVSLSDWSMDLTSVVDLVREEGTPLATIHLAGPLNAPSKSVKSSALTNLINNKFGDQIQDKLNGVLGEKGSSLVRGLFGGGSSRNTAPAETGTEAAPVTNNDNSATTEPAPAAPSIEKEAEKLIRGLFDKF